jgi:SAM-dependent methyltransferase
VEAPDLHPVSAERLLAWPGQERREPALSDRNYLVLASLAEQIQERIHRYFSGRRDISVLDIGCGTKPYLPFVAEFASTYRGIDWKPSPYADDVGAAEQLPYGDNEFDLVLCTQVLEHVGDPEAVVREINRVLSPGGVALVSTHGVALYHPDPRDLWRWTHEGLIELFNRAGSWSELEVVPNGNVIACIGYVVCQFVDEAGRRTRFDGLRRGSLATLNALCSFLDGRYPPRARVPRPGSLSANYVVTARTNVAP